MSLRTRLLAGYLIFIAALLVLGGWSAWRLREMGGVSRRIRAERVLAAYLWNQGRFPDHRLTVSDLTSEDLDVIASWARSVIGGIKEGLPGRLLISIRWRVEHW